jgi:hypothetical protein
MHLLEVERDRNEIGFRLSLGEDQELELLNGVTGKIRFL